MTGIVIKPGKRLLYRGRPFRDPGCRPVRIRIGMRLASMGIDCLSARYNGISRDSICRHMRGHVTQDERATLADFPLLLIRVRTRNPALI
jgi:hypothetical protein